jgi:hypothetical protein
LLLEKHWRLVREMLRTSGEVLAEGQKKRREAVLLSLRLLVKLTSSLLARKGSMQVLHP